ncbi:hypothetical protein SODG_005602 [Sodalis praecaptivus]
MTADRPYWQSFLAPLLADSRLQIVLTGAGSSAFAGRALAPWLRQQTGRDVKAYGTTDIVANPYHYLDPSRPLLLVSFARSGNSPESVAAVALADQCVPACHHLLLVCNPDSQLCDWAAGKAHVCTQVMPEGTHDKSFAMTSSFSSMLLAGLLLLGPQDIAQTAAPWRGWPTSVNSCWCAGSRRSKRWRPAVTAAISSSSAVASPVWRRRRR